MRRENKSSKWTSRDPRKDMTPQAEKGKKLGAKLRFKKVLPEPELEDIILGYRR